MRLALPPQSCKVYTPAALADAMIATLGDEPQFHWLEPSHGSGVFLETLARRCVPQRRIVALDLDPTPSPADHLARTFRGVDFLRWSLQTDCRFDRIVGNPPYIAISQLPVSLRTAAAGITDFRNRPIGNGANVWYAFVLASLKVLKPGGSVAFVLPSSAEFADYAEAMRVGVRQQFERLEIYRSDRPFFSQVQEGNLIAVARHFRSHPFRIVRRRFATATALISALSQSEKISGRRCPERARKPNERTVSFRTVADLRLGGVTGDARYFLMNEATRRQYSLPLAAFTPVVSRARHVRSSYIDDDGWNALREDGDRVWLFNPSDSTLRNPAVQRYLRRRVGGCNRKAFKVSHRTPWFRTPLPLRPHAFLSGMSQIGPWLCINEATQLNATNTLYVASFKDASRNEQYGIALSFLSSSVRQQLKRAGRRYADGLVKYEPSALANVELPLLREGMEFRSLYVVALEALLGGKTRQAMEIADSVCLSNESLLCRRSP